MSKANARTWFNSLFGAFKVVRKDSVKGSKDATTSTGSAVRVTGLFGEFAPSEDSFREILDLVFRTENSFGAPTALHANAKDALIDYYTWRSKNNGNEVVFRLRDPSLTKLIPFARRLSESRVESLSNISRTSWCGLKVPVLNGKTLMLTHDFVGQLQRKRLWKDIHWYTLVFRHFEPDIVYLKNNIREIDNVLRKVAPEFAIEADTDRDGTALLAKSKVMLKCDSIDDSFSLRRALNAAGLSCQLLESKSFNAREAFCANKLKQEGEEFTETPLVTGINSELYDMSKAFHTRTNPAVAVGRSQAMASNTWGWMNQPHLFKYQVAATKPKSSMPTLEVSVPERAEIYKGGRSRPAQLKESKSVQQVDDRVKAKPAIMLVDLLGDFASLKMEEEIFRSERSHPMSRRGAYEADEDDREEWYDFYGMDGRAKEVQAGERAFS